MYSVSDVYKQEMLNDLRGESTMQIAHAIPDALNNDPDTHFPQGLNITESNVYFNDQVKAATMEPTGCLLDGSYYLRVDADNPNYENKPDDFFLNGVSATTKVLDSWTTLYFTKTFTAATVPKEMFLKFDNREMVKPTKFTMQMFNASDTSISPLVEYKDGVDYDGFSAQITLPVITSGLESSFKYIKIYFTEMNLPYVYARVEKFIFGTVNEFGDTQISSCDWSVSADPLTFSIPTAEFTFTFLDPDKIYHESNPNGKLDKIVENQQVGFRFGYNLEGGGIEWVNGGLYRTTGEKNVSEDIVPQVTIKTRHMCVAADNSVKEMDDLLVSTDDITEALVSLRNENHSLETLWDSLDIDINFDLIETTPGTPDNVKDTFTMVDANIKLNVYTQLMCNACGLIWLIDRSNSVNESFTLREFLKLLQKSSHAYDSVSLDLYGQSPDFKNLFNGIYLFQFNNSNLLELPRISSVPVSDGIDFAEYDHSVNNTIRSIYPEDSAGTKLIKIDNPMVTINYDSPTTEPNTKYGQYVWTYYQEHKTYVLVNRGFPELDVGDIIHLYTKYYKDDGETLDYTIDKRCIVISNKISYAGTIQGETKVLEWDLVLGE